MKNRDNFMLELQKFKRYLYYDRIAEALESLGQALASYEKPEIYNVFDIELIHFIIHLDDTLTFEKGVKFLKKLQKCFAISMVKTLKLSHFGYWI